MDGERICGTLGDALVDANMCQDSRNLKGGAIKQLVIHVESETERLP